jgi:hypothetical protein
VGRGAVLVCCTFLGFVVGEENFPELLEQGTLTTELQLVCPRYQALKVGPFLPAPQTGMFVLILYPFQYPASITGVFLCLQGLLPLPDVGCADTLEGGFYGFG